MESAIPTTELTPEQKEKWASTRSMMMWKCPGFLHIFYKLLDNNNGDYTVIPTKAIPTACTDGKNIMVNPDWFFSKEMTLPNRVFVTAHEILHNMYGDVEMLHRCSKAGRVPMHDGSFLPFDNRCMQQAFDYRSNALLVDSKIGTRPTGKNQGCYDPKIAGANDSFLDVYKKVYKKKQEDEKNGKGKSGDDPFDDLMKPGQSTGQNPDTAAAGRNPQQWQAELQAAQQLEEMAARKQGDIAGALKRMFKEFLEPEVPWQEHIRTEMARRVGSGSYDFRRPDRRFIVRDIYVPSKSGYGAGWLVVWGDTSGSIGSKELESYMGELAGIIEDVHPRRLTILWCDAAISHVDEVEEAGDLETIRCRGVGGGGGTSCKPVFKWIQEHGDQAPDMFIGFTDGEVTFPSKEPAFPVIWASVQEYKYPWGDVVRINKRAR